MIREKKLLYFKKIIFITNLLCDLVTYYMASKLLNHANYIGFIYNLYHFIKNYLEKITKKSKFKLK